MFDKIKNWGYKILMKLEILKNERYRIVKNGKTVVPQIKYMSEAKEKVKNLQKSQKKPSKISKAIASKTNLFVNIFPPTRAPQPKVFWNQAYYDLRNGDAQRRYSNSVKDYLKGSRYAREDIKRQGFKYEDIKKFVEANRADPKVLYIERRQIAKAAEVHVENVKSEFGCTDHRHWNTYPKALKELERLKKWKSGK